MPLAGEKEKRSQRRWMVKQIWRLSRRQGQGSRARAEVTEAKLDAGPSVGLEVEEEVEL